MSCTRNCHQGRQCPARRPGGRTCQDLGVCQSLPACPSHAPAPAARHDGASLPPGGFWFSPGALDGPHRPRPQPLRISGRRIGAALWFVVSAASIAITVGFASGYLRLPVVLP